ncbi:MAG TPA: hypothetical protein VMF11_09585 [Candidatus Baltobacteraceae bacterium]|nr:hypothetical protein [Candidatus Baltobacteraceae bacterium]
MIVHTRMRARTAFLYSLIVCLNIPAAILVVNRASIFIASAALIECAVLIGIALTIRSIFKSFDHVLDVTTKATAEALADEIEEKTSLQAELSRLRAIAS